MSFQRWQHYGYGICTDNIKMHDVNRLKNLLSHAPKFNAQVDEWVRGVDIQDPTWNNYMEYDEYNLGLAAILKGVIQEAEGIRLTACDNFEGKLYLIYPARLPWNYTDIERGLTKEPVTEIFQRYIGLLTDESIPLAERVIKNSD